MKIEFETFKIMDDYAISNFKKEFPSAVNFLSYRKYKITVEEIEESNEALVDRLENMLINAKSYAEQGRIKDEIKKLTK